MSGRRFAPAFRHFLFPPPLGERRLLGALCALLRSAAFLGPRSGAGKLWQVFEKQWWRWSADRVCRTGFCPMKLAGHVVTKGVRCPAKSNSLESGVADTGGADGSLIRA